MKPSPLHYANNVAAALSQYEDMLERATSATQNDTDNVSARNGQKHYISVQLNRLRELNARYN